MSIFDIPFDIPDFQRFVTIDLGSWLRFLRRGSAPGGETSFRHEFKDPPSMGAVSTPPPPPNSPQPPTESTSAAHPPAAFPPPFLKQNTTSATAHTFRHKPPPRQAAAQRLYGQDKSHPAPLPQS